jgi:hypothetical protein
VATDVTKERNDRAGRDRTRKRHNGRKQRHHH